KKEGKCGEAKSDVDAKAKKEGKCGEGKCGGH
ncbi:HvfA family oxazolone/thioamide-modified RiPP metallophore, partial [Pseudoalteromonas nigrifaciens]